jgi:hypothetical protein
MNNQKVDVLAVMDKDRIYAYASRHSSYRDQMDGESKAARAAVAELIAAARRVNTSLAAGCGDGGLSERACAVLFADFNAALAACGGEGVSLGNDQATKGSAV